MRQGSVCRLRPARPGTSARLVIVLQHDLLSDLKTRLVAPLLTGSEIDPMGKLTPPITFQNDTYRIGLHQIVAVDRNVLGSPLGWVDAREEVMRGLDLLFTGV